MAVDAAKGCDGKQLPDSGAHTPARSFGGRDPAMSGGVRRDHDKDWQN